ncbi:MAG TPA: tetratricopeptide repeat protein [Stellaceae bacterium]|nr:tetratricopeptide repeat protein [Stellaceae bacterium]
MSDIFREIDEELRRDNLLQLWKRYGRYVIAGAVVILAVAGGVAAWRQHQLSERKAVSTRYFGALSAIGAGKNADAEKMFAALAQTGGGYALLARFEQAGLLAESGDKAGAIAIYDSIAKSSDADSEFRDLATLLSVMRGLPDGDPKAAVERLAPLTKTGEPWRPTALDLTAAADLKAGDKPAALKIYKELADDLAAPEGLRSRAAQLAAALAPL